MAKEVTVILLEDVASVGRAGDIVSVADGYARNALFPAGSAALATEQIKKQQSKAQAKAQEKAAAQTKKLQDLADKYANTEILFKEKTNEGQELYGSLKANQIATRLSKETGLKIKTKDLVIPGKAIKKTGSYPVTIKLSSDIEFSLNIVVTASNQEEISKQSADE